MDSKLSRFACALALMLAPGAGPSTALAAAGDSCDPGDGNGDGLVIVDGDGDEVCVPRKAADGLEKCQTAGWGTVVFSGMFGDSAIVFVNCTILTRDYVKHKNGGADADGDVCALYLSGGNLTQPLCSEAFGSDFDFPESGGDDDDRRFIYNCPDLTEPDPDYAVGAAQRCVPAAGMGVCEELFNGQLQTAVDGRQVCSGIDQADTFCIVDSSAALPCRGLFKHVFQCNADYNRPARNPFLCAPACPDQTVAVGAGCVPAAD